MLKLGIYRTSAFAAQPVRHENGPEDGCSSRPNFPVSDAVRKAQLEATVAQAVGEAL
jgi:hypothetical protein